MLIERLRPNPTADELAELYAHHNDADRWAEHRLRVRLTVDLARSRFPNPGLVVDPAAGNRVAAFQIATNVAAGGLVTGDLAPDAPVTHPGTPALELLAELDGQDADVVILGEILEHVDDPLELLRAARRAGTGLVLSTPLAEPAGINPEHVWRWDADAVRGMLDLAGWAPRDYIELDYDVADWPHPFRCQIHTATVGPEPMVDRILEPLAARILELLVGGPNDDEVLT